MDSVGYGVLGRDDEIEMDVFVADGPLDDCKPFPLADEFENSLEFCFNIVIGQYFSSVSGSPDYMVLADVSTVFKFVEFGQHKITSFLWGDFIIFQELTL